MLILDREDNCCLMSDVCALWWDGSWFKKHRNSITVTVARVAIIRKENLLWVLNSSLPIKASKAKTGKKYYTGYPLFFLYNFLSHFPIYKYQHKWTIGKFVFVHSPQ